MNVGFVLVILAFGLINAVAWILDTVLSAACCWRSRRDTVVEAVTFARSEYVRASVRAGVSCAPPQSVACGACRR